MLLTRFTPFYYRLSEDRSRSLVGAILSKVVPATFSTIASFSKMIWRSEPSSPKKPNVKPQPFARGKNYHLFKLLEPLYEMEVTMNI